MEHEFESKGTLLLGALSLAGALFAVFLRPFGVTTGYCALIFCFTSGAPTVFGLDENIFVALVLSAVGAFALYLSFREEES